MMDGKQQIASIRQISLYSRNAPFSGERWLLVGVVGENNLFSFSQSVTKLLGLAVLLTLGIGLACAFFVSYGLAQPVAQLSKELVDAQEQRKAVPEFSRTGIRELDQLAEAIVTLSTDNYKAAVAERSRIEHERDYDALTGLYSRQAFFRVCGELFEKPNTLRHAALMMTDLDNLKTINDTYGHDWGDVYLRQTAHSLQQGSPSGTVVARLSGDEFLLLFYGYETREALRTDIKKLEENFAQNSATLPDGKRLCIRMSGGVAWYPEDALQRRRPNMTDLLQGFLSGSAAWGVLLTLAAFALGTLLNKATGKAIFNPLLLGSIFVIILLSVLNIPYAEYKVSAAPVNYLLLPATISLAIPLYEKWDLLKENAAAIIAGISVGTLVSLGSALALTLALDLTREQYATLLPKSVTTAISMDVAAELGGIAALTGAIVILTGIAGNLLAEVVCKIFHITDPIAKGVGIGTSAHAVGTSKALQMGEVEGAMSGLSIAVAGVLTAVLCPFFVSFIQ